MKPRILIPATDIRREKSLKDLERCLTSIDNYTEFTKTVIFDSCYIGFVDYFRSRFDIDVIENTGNRLNFARNTNLGLRLARERNESVFLLNQDTKLREDQGLDLKKISSVVGIVNLKACNDQNDIPKGSGELVELDEGSKVAFYGTFLHSEVIQKIGVLDGIFRRGGMEDDDLQIRARLAGFKVYSCDRYVYHEGSYIDSSDPNWVSASGSYNAADLGFNLSILLTKYQASVQHHELQSYVLNNFIWDDSMRID